jgi:hypothetical protein
MAVDPVLADFEERFIGRRERGEIPEDAEIARRIAELESRYC